MLVAQPPAHLLAAVLPLTWTSVISSLRDRSPVYRRALMYGQQWFVVAEILVTLKTICFRYQQLYTPDQSIHKIVYLILKTEALVGNLGHTGVSR